VPNPIDLRDPAAVAARRPLRIAHRGGVVGPGAPENSLAAVERAAAAGYDLVELDVERSREGEPFLFHDRGGHLGRCCGVDARIADLPAAALAGLTYRASDQPLASLDAALARCAALGLGVVLDLKALPTAGTAPDVAERWLARIAELLDRHGLSGGSTMLLPLEPAALAAFGDRALTAVTPDEDRRARAGGAVDLAGRFWFGRADALADEAVVPLHRRGALVVPAVNRQSYPEHAHREFARRDVERLLAAGVDGLLFDSAYEGLLPRRDGSTTVSTHVELPGPTSLLRQLRAVRRYAARPVPDAVLADVVEVARWTGSSKNAQPWELIVVRERAVLAALAELAPNGGHLRGAALAVVLVTRSAQAAFDAGRLAERLMLAAWAHGVGSCPASVFGRDNPRRAKELLGVPPERHLPTVIGLGYPADARARFEPADRYGPLRRGRRPVPAFVSFEHYGRGSG
jgi:nitroreductase/glycerophosphoryl diester phosphodiesterase